MALEVGNAALSAVCLRLPKPRTAAARFSKPSFSVSYIEDMVRYLNGAVEGAGSITTMEQAQATMATTPRTSEQEDTAYSSEVLEGAKGTHEE
eukprot:6189092-Pleurochrysis_carterae.AAC.3